MFRRSALLVNFCLALWVAGCVAPPSTPAPESVGTWVVYWDDERGLEELVRHGGLFDYASLFAYELDPAGHPVPAPGVESLRGRFLAETQAQGIQAWATIVNDVRRPDGTVELKNAKIVQDILSDPVRRKDHARLLAERIARDGFRGLHLDYERIDARYADAFRDFVSLLGSELEGRGCDLNVVLEPQRGPRPGPGSARITVMAYNLHGPHGGPGPRATPAFVRDVVPEAGTDRRGTPTVALALAGFMWRPDGGVESVDWSNAYREARHVVVERGLFNRVPYARLPAGELWFEDAESLDVKWRAAHAAGFRGLALWRLGGNDERLFDWLATLSHDDSRQ